MVLETSHGPADARVTERIIWTPLDDGRVHQRWETMPAGKPATTSFDVRHERPKGKRGKNEKNDKSE